MIKKGIDKTVLKGFRVDNLDRDKLLRNDNVIFQEREIGVVTQDLKGAYVNINYLKITDGNVFNYLAVGVKMNKGVPNYYSLIEISISELTDSNLKPLTVSEYRNMVKRIFRYIEERYGLYIDISELYFDDIEINITAEMDRQFVEYDYLLENIKYLVPKIYEKSSYDAKDDTLKQFEFFNNSTHGKIYDKTRQLSERFKIKLDKQYMRIEYTLHGSKKIESSLGTKYVDKITDKAIYDYLVKMINKDLINPIERHIETSNKKLLKMAKELKENDSRKWAKIFLTTAIAEKIDLKRGKLPLVVDIEQIKEIISKVSTSKNRNRTLERLKDDIERHTYLLNNIEKLNEIINKFAK